MHPVLKLLHILVLLWMTGIRYFINDHLANQPSTRPLISGCEIDWLSMTLAKGLQDAPWSQTLEAKSHAESDSVLFVPLYQFPKTLHPTYPQS